MIDFLTMIIAGPFLMAATLSSSFLITLIAIALVLFGTGFIGHTGFSEEYEHYELGVVCSLLLLAVYTVSLFATMDVFNVGTVVFTVISFLISYAVYGLVALLVIWPLAKRKHVRLTRKAVSDYEKLLPKDQTEQEWARVLRQNSLQHSYKFPSAKSGEGRLRMLAYISLWHLYLLDLSIGGFLRELPDMISRLFGGSLDNLSKLAGTEAKSPFPEKTSDNS